MLALASGESRARVARARREHARRGVGGGGAGKTASDDKGRFVF